MASYSETLTEHVMSPRNGGAIEDADLTGHAGAPGRGAFMILFKVHAVGSVGSGDSICNFKTRAHSSVIVPPSRRSFVPYFEAIRWPATLRL